jgi:eukaryotic-like serine/threonine-protein kinase
MTPPIALSDWPRLLSLVEQGVEVPAAERDNWLRALDLPAPLRDALRCLLQERQAIESLDFLAALPAVTDAADAAAPSPFQHGALIGPWRLWREIGQGGMSVVWLAERADGQLKRQVALKLPHAGPGQDLLARRMLRERKILAALEHPHIARLYDVGLTDGGTPYLVMEYVEGQNLLAYADAKHLNIHQRLLLFRQVLDAVQYAHGQLVLHRDLKPDNILVNARGHVKLLDFGIAKVMAGEGSSNDSTALTRATHRQLTPNYASPEQLQNLPMGTASDVYALGVVLYELLCGSRPHGVAGGSVAQLEAAVLNNDPLPPSRRVVDVCDAAILAARSNTSQTLAKTLRGDLDAIVLKALAKTPEQRYASADALSSDISRWRHGDSVTARNPSAWSVLRKIVRRHRWAFSLGGLATVALISAAAVALVQGQLAKREALRAASARDFLLELFQESSPDRMRGVELTAKQLLEQGRLKANTQLGTQTQLQGELLLGIGQAQHQVGDTRGAQDALQQSATAFRAGGDAFGEASAYLAQLDVAFDEDDYDTVDALLRTLAPLLPAVKTDPLLQLRWLVANGRFFNNVGNSDKAQSWLLQALALAKPSDAPQQAIAFRANIEMREALSNSFDDLGAARHRAAAEQTPTDPKTLSVGEKTFHMAMSDIMEDRRRDRIGPLLKRLPEVVAACVAELGYTSTRCDTLKFQRLIFLGLYGDAVTARKLVEPLLPWLRQNSSPHARWRAARFLSISLALDGQTDENLEPISRLELLLSTEGAEKIPIPQQMPMFFILAEIRLRAGDREGARHWHARAAAVMDRAVGDRPFAEFHLRVGRALVLQSEGQHAAALSEVGQGVCESNVPPRARAALISLNCVRSLAAVGKQAQAIELTTNCIRVLTTSLGADAPNTLRAQQLLNELQAPGGYRPLPWHPSQIWYAF